MNQPLQQLYRQTHRLPKDLRDILEQAWVEDKRKQKIITCLQTEFQNLKVDVTYLLYDLECTRRERDRER